MNADKYIRYDKSGRAHCRYYTIKYLARCSKSKQK